MEIERKFLIESFPDFLPLKSECDMQQIYISFAPVVRARSKNADGKESYRLTVKGKGELCREEIETSITKEQFEGLMRIAGKEPIKKHKKNYCLPDGHILECSLVDGGTENEFMYAEVEFSSVKEAESFEPPEYLVKEVTYDNYYKMNRYWQRTRLDV
jgi:CYTH domain-containing protein